MRPLSTMLLVRHGQSIWNAAGRWQGHADPALSALGEAQATHAGATWPAGGDLIVSSDLQRARHTASILSAETGIELGPVVSDVRERAAGAWEGLTHAEIEQQWPGALEDGRRPPGFEQDETVVARTTRALHDLAAANQGRVVIVVTHGGVIRAHERHAGIVDRGRIANLGGLWVHVHPDRIEVADRIVLIDESEVTVPSLE